MSEKSWVEPRYRCTLDASFCDLVCRLKADVAEFKKLSNEADIEAKFEQGELVVRRWTRPEGGRPYVEDENKVVVRCTDNSILATRKKCLHIEVTRKWDPEALSCNLLVDGKVLLLWQISQLILGDFLFEDGARS